MSILDNFEKMLKGRIPTHAATDGICDTPFHSRIVEGGYVVYSPLYASESEKGGWKKGIYLVYARGAEGKDIDISWVGDIFSLTEEENFILGDAGVVLEDYLDWAQGMRK